MNEEHTNHAYHLNNMYSGLKPCLLLYYNQPCVNQCLGVNNYNTCEKDIINMVWNMQIVCGEYSEDIPII